MRNRDLEVSWRGGGGGVGNFQCRPINPVILFYLIDCSMRLHVSSFTNRAGLKQLVTTVWIKPKASQAHVSRKRKQLTHEGVTRCVTRQMGNRNNRDGKTSLKRQRTPENTTDTQDAGVSSNDFTCEMFILRNIYHSKSTMFLSPYFSL